MPSAGAGEPVDHFLGVAAVAAVGASGDQHALLVPAPQLLHRDAQQFGHFLDGVFRSGLLTSAPLSGVTAGAAAAGRRLLA